MVESIEDGEIILLREGYRKRSRKFSASLQPTGSVNELTADMNEVISPILLDSIKNSKKSKTLPTNLRNLQKSLNFGEGIYV